MTSAGRVPDPPHQPSLVPEADVPGGPSLTIGEVLARLRPAFPELTISKIRFYEAQGLLAPQRTSSGYRKFGAADVARLRYILTAARDHYLPLKVIKSQLEALDRGVPPHAAAQNGLAPSTLPGSSAGSDETTTVVDATQPAADDPLVAQPPAAEPMSAELLPEAFAAEASEVRLSRGELLRASGLTDVQLAELEQFGLVSSRPGSSYFDGDALLVAKIAAQLSRYGLQARHLRPVKAAAEREIGLVEQVVSPLARQRSSSARAQAAQAGREIASLSVRLHAALVSIGLRAALRR